MTLCKLVLERDGIEAWADPLSRPSSIKKGWTGLAICRYIECHEVIIKLQYRLHNVLS